MRVTLEWASYNFLIFKDVFLITAKILNAEKRIWKETTKAFDGSLHPTRRFEYPWCVYKTSGFDVGHKEYRALDAGGGGSAFPFYLSPSYKEVHIVDIDAQSIGLAMEVKEKMPQFKNVHIRETNLLDMGFNDGYFDHTFCISVLEHGGVQSRIEDGLHELLRVTKRKLMVTMDVGVKSNPNGPISFKTLHHLSDVFCFEVPELSSTSIGIMFDDVSLFVACLCFDLGAS